MKGVQEDRKARKARVQKARYERRKLEQRCIDCDAGLQEDDGLRCVECAESATEAKRKYWASGKPCERTAAWHRADYAQRKAIGVCLHCSKPAAPGGVMCSTHRAEASARSVASKRRRKQGIALMPKSRAAPQSVQSAPYHPMDGVLSKPTVRVLRAIRFFDWAPSADILDAAGAPEYVFRSGVGTNTERNGITSALKRLASDGLVDRRGSHPRFEYRINARGKAALTDMIQNNQIVCRRAA